MSCHQVVSAEAEEQAGDICRLMESATAGQTAIRYVTHKRLHPLVHHVLTSKGYIVREEPHQHQAHMGVVMTSASPFTTYVISVV